MMKVRFLISHLFFISIFFLSFSSAALMVFVSVSVILLQLNNIDVNETVEGDDRAFEIWHEREDSVRKYTLQARTVTIKNSWLRDFRELQQRYSMPAWSEFTFTHALTFACNSFITHNVYFSIFRLSNITFHDEYLFTGPPDFDEILANCTAELGQTVKLACKATGIPKPTVTWYKGTSFIFCSRGSKGTCS